MIGSFPDFVCSARRKSAQAAQLLLGTVIELVNKRIFCAITKLTRIKLFYFTILLLLFRPRGSSAFRIFVYNLFVPCSHFVLLEVGPSSARGRRSRLGGLRAQRKHSQDSEVACNRIKGYTAERQKK